ncbi:sensor histidine kinase [Salibacterium salarium]|uniref:Sensor histidine kinase n=1 Tax=Salibacterium salarium TaxID=284579 RepID=A0A3R9Q623_9BACI|nr:sensor histidine kinase [Salibacterium salarium]RSL34382.1 sensor histidine kinase [Salibacterium salarium]
MKKMVNIQWDYIRHSLGIAVLSVFLLFLILLSSVEDMMLLLSFESWFQIPVLLLWAFLSLTLAVFIGWRTGRRQKIRMNHLIVSTMALEKGEFSKRTTLEGEDELGVMSTHLNAVANRLQEQAASMQKLSDERVEYQTSIKRDAVADERQRLARELHDAVSQQLFAISMTTAALQKTMNIDCEKSMEQAALIEKMAVNAQGEMRALLMHLRPVSLDGKGLREGLSDLIAELSEKTNVEIKHDIQRVEALGKGMENHLFRIAQEALSNVIRHAEAGNIDFQLKWYNGQLRMKVIDDGIGFHLDNNQKHSSYGLSMMKERVNELGGVIHILSYPGKGTQIDVKVNVLVSDEEEHGRD